MSRLLGISALPFEEFCTVHPLRTLTASRLPRPGDVAIDFLDDLRAGAMPVVSPDGTMWGVLSPMDLRDDVKAAHRGSHGLGEFRLAARPVERVATRLYEPPLQHGQPITRALTWFSRGARRVMVVDDQNRPVGYIEMVDFLDAIFTRFPELLGERTLQTHVMATATELLACLAEPLKDLLLRMHLHQRVVLVTYAGRLIRALTATDVLKALPRDAPIDTVTVGSIVDSKASAPTEFPWAVALPSAKLREIWPALRRHHEIIVMRPGKSDMDAVLRFAPDGVLLLGPNDGQCQLVGHINLCWLCRKVLQWLDEPADTAVA